MRITWNELDELLLPSRQPPRKFGLQLTADAAVAAIAAGAGEAKPSGAMLC